MDSRHELAEMYPHLPSSPVLDLIAKVQLTFEHPDDHPPLPTERMIDPDSAGTDGPPTEEALLDRLTTFVCFEHLPDEPFAVHAARALAVLSGSIGVDGAEKARYNDRTWVDENTLVLVDHYRGEAPPEAFPYRGAWMLQATDEVKVTVARFADDIEAVCFANGTRRTHPRDLGVALAARLATTALAAVQAAPRVMDGATVVLTPSDSVPIDALRYLAQLFGERMSLDILALVDAPVPTALRFEPEDGTVETTYDLSRPAEWWSKPSTVAHLAAFVTRQPHLGDLLAGQLHHALRDASGDAALAVAQAHPAFFVAVLQTDARRHLEGAAELVDVACRIPDVELRLKALTALGAPAADALAAEVRTLVPLLDDDEQRGEARHQLRQAAEHGHALGLRFWLNLLDRPGVFDVAWSSRRLRAALMIDPTPIHRLIRRGAADPKHAQVAWQALGCLPIDKMDAPDLSAVASEIVALVEAAQPGSSRWASLRALLLADDAITLDPLSQTLDSAMAPGERSARMLTWLATFEVAGSILAQLGEPTRAELVDAIAETHFVGSICPSIASLLVEHFVESDERQALDLCCLTHRDGATRVELDRSWDALEAACRAGGAADGHIRALLGVVDAGDLRVPADPRLEHLQHLQPADFAHLQEGLGALMEALVVNGSWGNVWRRALEAVRTGLLHRTRGLDPTWSDGEGDRMVAAIGEDWPTRTRLTAAAAATGTDLSSDALDRFADEALPRAFRMGLRHMPGAMESVNDFAVADPHAIVRGVMTTLWDDEPALCARHLAAILPETTGTWRRGVVLALVALREPCGTAVPDALTKAMHAASGPEEAAFLKAQRDSFKRASVAIEARKPARERVRKALKRLQIHARRV